jgi:hypothetical protein
MDYHIDGHSTDLAALQKRLQSTDLIPSQEPLLDDITEKMSALAAVGVNNLADLRAGLNSPKALAALSRSSGISADYLKLLKRTINGFFPKSRLFKDMDWLDKNTILNLKQAGLENTHQLFDAASRGAIGSAILDKGILSELVAISDLCRVQWVSPKYARAIAAAGFKQASEVARADPETLTNAIASANEGAKFYKGKVGLRDVRRLVMAAGYVP